MPELTKIKGNQQNIDYIARSYEKRMLSHAYIINGPAASGKEAFAEYIAAALLCDEVNAGNDTDPNQQDWGAMLGLGKPAPKAFMPCGHCPSCIKAASGNHPDIIHVHHDKATVLSVDEVRKQIVDDISIKPYYGPYKVYIIDDAHLLNENGQNALLKTIEEPAEYGVVFLLTDNSDGFLQTIRSRCIRINMDPLSKEEITAGFSDENGQKIFDILTNIKGLNALEISKRAKELEELDKNQIIEMLRLWFRDVLVLKSTGDKKRMTFEGFMRLLEKMSADISFEGINNIILAVDEAEARLKASVKAEAVYENLMLAIRREYNSKGSH